MIKVGIVGVRRGSSFINSAKETGMELVAICDIWEEKLHEAGKRYNGQPIPITTSFGA